MAITDNDLIALSSLSEVDRRRVRDMPRGIGPAALLRLERLLLVKPGGGSDQRLVHAQRRRYRGAAQQHRSAGAAKAIGQVGHRAAR